MNRYWYNLDGNLAFSDSPKSAKDFFSDNDHLSQEDPPEESRKSAEELHNAQKSKSKDFAANESHMFELVDLMANWLARENEFTIPPELKSAVMAWQGRKGKK